MDTSLAPRLGQLIAESRDRPGALLPLLHDIQDEFGHIPAEAEAAIARALNLSRAEVHGVISYYHHFRQTPPGKHVVRVCCAEACQANGAVALAEHAQTHHDGKALSVEPVYCLGLCASGPAIQIDEEHLHAHVTPEKFDALIAALEAKR
jgi:formate dehydrogenase subunit gamma